MVSGRTRRVEFSRVRISSPMKRGPYGDGSDDEEQDIEASSETLDYTPGYIYLNWTAILGHLASVIGMLIIYLPEEPVTIPYTETYLAWERNRTVLVNGTNTSSCTGATRNTANDGEFCLKSETDFLHCGDDRCGLDYGWLIISFHMLSFLFQLLAAMTDPYPSFKLCGFSFKICGKSWPGFSLFGYQYSEMIKSGKNPLRFIEYSISASIMLIIIAIINGIFDIHHLLAIGVLTCSCQLCGLVVEFLDVKQLGLMWINHLNGWITFCSAYYIIARAFFASLAFDPDIQPPSFVYAIVVAIFLLYASFGFVQLVELTCLTCPCGDTTCVSESKPGRCYGCCRVFCPAYRTEDKKGTLRCNPLYKEMVFVTLSLGAKLTLGWLLFVNVFMA